MSQTYIKNIPDDVRFDIDDNTRIEWNREDNRATIIQETAHDQQQVNVTFDSINKLQKVLGDIDQFMEYAINH